MEQIKTLVEQLITPGRGPKTATRGRRPFYLFSTRNRGKNKPVASLLGLVIFLLGLSSCNVTKYFPEGKYLYDGAAVNVSAADSLNTDELSGKVNSVLDNSTNAKLPILGYYEIYRWYKFEEKLEEKPDKFGDKPHWGKKPKFYSETLVEEVNTLIENRASNEGYFNNQSEWQLDTSESDRTISVEHELLVGAPYLIDSVRQYWRDSIIAQEIKLLEKETFLQPGKRYQLDRLKGERKRWEIELRDRGFYYITENDFIYFADTVAGNNQVDILVKTKDDLPARRLMPQRIAAINVYSNTAGRDTSLRYGPGDTTSIGGLNVICKECPLRPEIIDEAFAQRAGDLYSPTVHQTTLRRLAKYNTFRYIAMNYRAKPGSDSLLILDAFMEPRLRRRFEGELGLSYNNADYFGPNARLAYVNRNLLRGAELLRVEGDFSLAQFLGQQGEARVPNAVTLGLTSTLEIPRLWLPKRRKLIPRVITSGTKIELGGKVESLRMNLEQFGEDIAAASLTDLAAELEADPDATERLSLAQFRVQFGYTWQRRLTKNHELNPLSIRIQNPVVSNQEVLDLARLSNLAPNVNNQQTSRFDRMVVISPNYTFNYDSRKKDDGTHEFFFQQFVSMNMNNVFPVGQNADSRERETSYYPLLESDFRYYLRVSSRGKIATRFHGGIAFPLFSDRAIVPYFDLFSIGGPNSLRGFAPRQLGPGNTVPFENNLLTFGGFGNLLLEGSVEYRHKVNNILELAIFADAGNIWTYRTELVELESDFKTEAFSGELAVDAGIGFRFDLQFLVLRIDLAQPLQLPYAENLEFLRPPFAAARNVPDDNLRLVVAFGYPF